VARLLVQSILAARIDRLAPDRFSAPHFVQQIFAPLAI
jgi:hypothetical protein